MGQQWLNHPSNSNPERKKIGMSLDLSVEDMKELIWGCLDGYQDVVKPEISEQSRWHTFWFKIIQQTETGNFYDLSWARGSTESQDEGPENVTIMQVYPHEVTTTIYNTTQKDTK